MLNLRPFQILTLGIFGLLFVFGILALARYSGFVGEANPYGQSVEIWGVLDGDEMLKEIQSITEADERFYVVTYREFDPRTFADELTNAIAEGRGPDAVILTHEEILRERPKILPVPYETLPQRSFNDTYIDGATIFNLSDGTYGFPIAVDPLVLYYNRDMLAAEDLVAPPRTWEELLNQAVPRLTKRSSNNSITQSAVALGEYQNVKNAKDILLMLMLQAGSSLVDDYVGTLELRFNETDVATSRPPADASLDFYTQFANPGRTVYSWNRSLPQDTQAFLSGDLAFYFGFASEVDELRGENPNLNFDATRVPQAADATIKRNYGLFYTLALLRSSDNRDGAYQAMVQLAGRDRAASIAEANELAPVFRSTIAARHQDPFMQNAYDGALTARGWLDPNPVASENVFKRMIEDVTSGRTRISSAVADAQTRINQLFR